MPGEVTLRKLLPDDVEAYYGAVLESVVEVSPWLTWCRASYTIGQAREFIARAAISQLGTGTNSVTWGIFVDGFFAGCISLNRHDAGHKTANVGYWVRTSMAGHGIGTKAVKTLIRFAAALGIHRLEIFMSTKNVASKRVAEKAGACYEGKLLDRLLYRGEWHNAYLFSLLTEGTDNAAPAR